MSLSRIAKKQTVQSIAIRVNNFHNTLLQTTGTTFFFTVSVSFVAPYKM